MGGKPKPALFRDQLIIEPGIELRTYDQSISEELFSCVEYNRSRLREWMPWLDLTTSVDQLNVFVQSSIDGYQTGSCYRLAIFVDGKVGGVISLEGIDTMHRLASMGYWLSSKHGGKGVMGKCVTTLLRYAFHELDLHCVEVRAATKNHRSRNVASRAGMHFDGILRQREWLYDHYVDHAVYSLLASEFATLR